jgi:hypothetical protein
MYKDCWSRKNLCPRQLMRPTVCSHTQIIVWVDPIKYLLTMALCLSFLRFFTFAHFSISDISTDRNRTQPWISRPHSSHLSPSSLPFPPTPPGLCPDFRLSLIVGCSRQCKGSESLILVARFRNAHLIRRPRLVFYVLYMPLPSRDVYSPRPIRSMKDILSLLRSLAFRITRFDLSGYL